MVPKPLFCPYLPKPEAVMSHKCLTDLGPKRLTGDFYFKALQYGHYLWFNGHTGRAILAITRGLYSMIDEQDAILKEWELPYAAMKWLIQNHSSDDFPGNPRISFQHQATRIKGQRQELRRARAWAVWALICQVRPNLPADTKQTFQAPNKDQILSKLIQYGHANEAILWQSTLEGSSAHSLAP